MTGTAGEPSPLAALYREVILAHAASPVGEGRPIAVTHEAEGHNLLCGDRVTIRLQVNESTGIIEATAFDAEACAICTASSSLLCEHLPGQPAAGIVTILDGFQQTVAAGAEKTDDCPAYLVPMLGVKDYPARVACATLPWRTAIDAVRG